MKRSAQDTGGHKSSNFKSEASTHCDHQTRRIQVQSLQRPTFPWQSTVDRLVRVPIGALQNPAAPIVDDVKADLVRIDVYLPAGESRGRGRWGAHEVRQSRKWRETLSCKGMRMSDEGDGFSHQVR